MLNFCDVTNYTYFGVIP